MARGLDCARRARTRVRPTTDLDAMDAAGHGTLLYAGGSRDEVKLLCACVYDVSMDTAVRRVITSRNSHHHNFHTSHTQAIIHRSRLSLALVLALVRALAHCQAARRSTPGVPCRRGEAGDARALRH